MHDYQQLTIENEVQNALACISADERDAWIKCGMAIKQELGDQGFGIWDKWSSTSPKYSAVEAQKQWKSFKSVGEGVGIRTLFYLAKKNGFVHSPEFRQEHPSQETLERQQADSLRNAEELAQKRSAAAIKAQNIWKAIEEDAHKNLSELTSRVQQHPYVVSKGIDAKGALWFTADSPIGGMSLSNALVLPLKKNGTIVSLQFISADGEKRFLPHGEKGSMEIGNFSTVTSPICICEGYATGASIHQATRYPVVVACDAGNLPKVAAEYRKRNPSRKIIICADDDETGLKAAESAATLIDGYIAVPKSGSLSYSANGGKDFNDLAQQGNPDEVKHCVDNADKASVIEKQTSSSTAPSTSGSAPAVNLVCAASLTPQPIDWIWKDWLAGGKLHVLAGQAGTGKTTIAINFAATVSNGGQFPDGARAKQGNVLIWSAEDGIRDTLVPRLIAANADLRRVHFVSNVMANGEAFDPAKDMKALADTASAIGGVSMLIVDPIVSVMTGDSHKNAEARKSLQPLVDLGEKLGCAVVGITHFTKGTQGSDPLERVNGSLAIGALARIVMVVGREVDEDDGEETLIFCRAKSNLGPDKNGFQYEITHNHLAGDSNIVSSTICWLGAVEGYARDLLPAAKSRKTTEVEKAIEFLSKFLENGAAPSSKCERECEIAGFAKMTVRRAKEKLKIESVKHGMDGGWYWKLPNTKSVKAGQHGELIGGSSEHLHPVNIFEA